MSLLDWFRGRPGPVPPPLQVAECGPPADAPDEWGLTSSEQGAETASVLDGVALAIEYADAAGEISVRRVIVRHVTPATESNFYIDGWCLLRNDWRRFRSDRILKLMVPPSWTAVPDLGAFLSEYFPEEFFARQSIDGVNPKLVCRDGLSVLLYVARADGVSLPPREREALRAYIIAACRRAGVDADDATAARVLAYADTLYPTERSLGRYLERLERDPGALDLLVPCLKALVLADDAYSVEEQEAVSVLLEAMTRARERIVLEKAEGEEVESAPPQPMGQSVQVGSFVALDVETANADMASICSIGLVHFKDGVVARKLTILVNPEDRFDPINISIHGIRPEHVANAKTIREVFPVVASALASVVVVHHTHFDRVALCRVAEKYGFSQLTCRWLDSARVARRAWERFSRSGYGLANLAEEFSIEFQHHDACEDARAAGLVLLRAMADTGLSLDAWLDRVEGPLGGAADDDSTQRGALYVGLTPEAARISELVEAVKSAKRDGRLDEACRMLGEEIERQEMESKSTGLGVAPWYYEQMAIVCRKQGRHADELAVLERYDRQIKAPGVKPAELQRRLEKVRARLARQR